MAALGLAVSAGLAQILTNLDNLAMLFALIPVVGARAAVLSYLAAQAVVVAAALVLAETSGFLGGGFVGLVGLVPLGLGLWTLWSRHRSDPSGRDTPLGDNMRRGLLTVMFLGLSGDSFAVLAPLLLDTAPGLRPAVAIGATTAALMMGAMALALSRVAGKAEAVSRRAEFIGPYVMIAAGLYVLMNTATDQL